MKKINLSCLGIVEGLWSGQRYGEPGKADRLAFCNMACIGSTYLGMNSGRVLWGMKE